MGLNRLRDEEEFGKTLYQRLSGLNSGIKDLEYYEFEYALSRVRPKEGWESFVENNSQEIQTFQFDGEFFEKIQLKPVAEKKIILDETILWLTRKLFVSLVDGNSSVNWINDHFYFDIRAFCFFIHTHYFNQKIRNNFGNTPYRTFDPKQHELERLQEIGYKDFKNANLEVDQAFIEIIYQLVQIHGLPIVLTLAGPTGAGKTEITERIHKSFSDGGLLITTIEMDNFFKDREYRDGKVYGKEVIHFDLFILAMRALLAGRSALIPRYDFYKATSSHDFATNLRDGQTPIRIDPADVIFLEGNFPFYIPELEDLITLRTVYLTDDPVRLKRKWRRDIDLRKKYDPIGFINRYFRTQYIRAQEIYLPLMEVCDLVVETSAANIWLKPEWVEILKKYASQKTKL